ncbi:Phosphoglycerol transferase MdoB [Pustulibacterium marinum]|uniref:Phosphoglycerol transferase MdoB n=1 Tax=Pustulibacterium marinum TaxID=1224947 RepID=A0A1I7I2U9_9FLAO|nr:LTA synthase family protein [Pustulibacterium marinum]SFU67248.1 Phosphoglycerol transferase MdoB [Pustulibacterium marinum]
MAAKRYEERYSTMFSYAGWFLLVSAVLRIVFWIWSGADIPFHVTHFLGVLCTGAFMDLGVLVFFCLPFSLYLAVFPSKWNGSLADKMLVHTGFVAVMLIQILTFFAEITFWEEFKSRFNFIAVDYLIYTYEVVHNINESYPIPLLLTGVALLVWLFWWLFQKAGIFAATFQGKASVVKKWSILVLNVILVAFFSVFINNTTAEWSANRYENEIGKAGIYSFFAAFRSNELNFRQFYETMPNEKAFRMVQHSFLQPIEKQAPNFSVRRNVIDSIAPIKNNVILICVESLSADVLGHFGNTDHNTPKLDSIIDQNLWFSNLFATGTRTVRGMEALSLSIPPTPGRSILKRKDNEHLFTVGSVFKQLGYTNTFLYGGDGYFDNMDYFFSNNGFTIVDRNRGLASSNDFETNHYSITDDEVTFENAWGVCDEDLFNKTISYTDTYVKTHTAPFFHFIMTTSNHRPYTYPEGTVAIPSGTGRKGAVAYTDYAIGEFLKEAQTKPWYANTTIVIVADHCASSAGRWELNIANYRIPAIVINAPGGQKGEINKMCSQIDLFPSLFALQHFSYETNLYGHNVFDPHAPERAFVGNYRKLGYLTPHKLTVLDEQGTANAYIWDRSSNTLHPTKTDTTSVAKAIANYQTADYLYHHNGLKE